MKSELLAKAHELGPGFVPGTGVTFQERRERAVKLLEEFQAAHVEPPLYLQQLAYGVVPGAEIKILDDGTAVVRGYAVVFGGVDLDGETFTPETDFWLDKLTPNPPMLYQHGMDEVFGRKVIGRVKTFTKDDVGLWMEAQIELHDEYRAFIEALQELSARKILGISTGSAAHLVERENGIIKSWAIVEVSLTPTPAEPRTLGVEVLAGKAKVVQMDPEVEADSTETKAAETASPEETQPESTNPKGEPTMSEEVTTISIESIVEEVVKRLDQPTKNIGVLTEAPAKPEEEVKEFQKFLRGERSVKLNTATDAGGGYFVPRILLDELNAAIASQSLFRRIGVRSFRMPSIRVDIPGFTYSANASILGEGVDVSETDPTANQIAFNAVRFSKLSKVSRALAYSSTFDVWREVLLVDFANAFAEAENQYFTAGTGTGQPQGVKTATVGATTASTTTINGDNIIDWVYSLDYKYRPGSVIMLHPSVIPTIRKLKDSTNQYLWQPGLAEGQPDRLLGYPVFENSYLDQMGATNRKIGVIFNPAYYRIGELPEIPVQVLNELYSKQDAVGYIAHRYMDGHIMQADAFRVLSTPAS
jgi:HK97 family phage major capsid protein/HK97 family phage prohead protease